MPYKKDIEPLSKQLTIVVGLTVVGFMAFGLALSFYRNILFEKTLQDLADQNHTIASTIDRGYADLEYYRSDQYRDKYAKENLWRLNRGEKLIILHTRAASVADATAADDATAKEEREAAYFEILRQMPVIEHWKLYLFEGNRIEELKRAL